MTYSALCCAVDEMVPRRENFRAKWLVIIQEADSVTVIPEFTTLILILSV